MRKSKEQQSERLKEHLARVRPDIDAYLEHESTLRAENEEAKRGLHKMPVSYGLSETLPQMVERAADELARRTLTLNELQSECDQWQKKQAESWAELEQLRDAKAGVVQINLANGLFGSDRYVPERYAKQLEAEIERLKRELHQATDGWAAAQEEINRLRTVLEIYGDPANWSGDQWRGPTNIEWVHGWVLAQRVL